MLWPAGTNKRDMFDLTKADSILHRVQTAVTMRQVTGSMAGVVRGMDNAMKAMDLEKVRHPLS